MKFNTEDFKYIEAIGDNVAKMRLDGSFGREIDGSSIAAEINFLDTIAKVKEIHLHFNTPGGAVFDSLSVVSAILGANATIHGHNDGICMSAGFHSFLSCDILHAYDFSMFMYHEAHINGNMSGKEISDSAKSFLAKTNEAMATLIANRLGKSQEEVADML